MAHKYEQTLHSIPLVRVHAVDTLLYVNALLHTLQHLEVKDGLGKEEETGARMMLEIASNALRFESSRRLSRGWFKQDPHTREWVLTGPRSPS